MKTKKPLLSRLLVFALALIMSFSFYVPEISVKAATDKNSAISKAEEDRRAAIEKAVLYRVSYVGQKPIIRFRCKKKIKEIRVTEQELYSDYIYTNTYSETIHIQDINDLDAEEIKITTLNYDGALTSWYTLQDVRSNNWKKPEKFKGHFYYSTFEFDSFGRVVSEHIDASCGGYAHYTYSYHPNGAVKRIEYFPDGQSYPSKYDEYDENGYLIESYISNYNYNYNDYSWPSLGGGIEESCIAKYSYEFDKDGDVIKQTSKGRFITEKVFEYYPLGQDPVEVSKLSIANIPDVTYTGSAIKPFISVKYGNAILKEGTDYSLNFSNNTKVGTASVTITGMGRYEGSVTKTFKIVKDDTANADVSYRTYVQSYGWQPFVKDGSVSGTYAQAKRLEGIQIKLSKKDVTGGITYRTYVQKLGWQAWAKDGAYSGTKGQGLRLESFQAKLTGNMAKNYDIYYRVQAQKFGWMGWAKNGATAGTAGYGYRLEAVQIQLVKKGGKAPTSNKAAYQKKG